MELLGGEPGKMLMANLNYKFREQDTPSNGIAKLMAVLGLASFHPSKSSYIKLNTPTACPSLTAFPVNHALSPASN